MSKTCTKTKKECEVRIEGYAGNLHESTRKVYVANLQEWTRTPISKNGHVQEWTHKAYSGNLHESTVKISMSQHTKSPHAKLYILAGYENITIQENAS